MRGKLLVLAVTAASAVMLVAAPAAQADDTICPPGLVGGIYDNVVVPQGESCTISGAVVQGNVKALKDSKLVIRDGSVVLGNVDGDRADIVQVLSSTVRENVNIKSGGPAAPPVPAGGVNCTYLTNPCEAFISTTTVTDGNIQIENMVGTVFVRRTTVENGNVTVRSNHIPGPTAATGEFLSVELENVFAQALNVARNTGSGIKRVTTNTAKEIACRNNEPPFLGGPNFGDASGQCF
jgi:hypothetical protein